MLVIREEQLAVLSQTMREGFVTRMLWHSRKVFPDKTRPWHDEELREIVRRGMVKAEHYGMHRECEVERYLDLMFLLSFEFDTFPWASRILQTAWEAPVKLDVLYAKQEVEDAKQGSASASAAW